MKTNSISFKAMYKIVSQNPYKTAQQLADMINNPYNQKPENVPAMEKLAQFVPFSDWNNVATFDLRSYGEAQAVTYNMGKSAYLFTGQNSRDVFELREDKIKNTEIALRNYSRTPQMVDMVRDFEEERYLDLLKNLTSQADSERLYVDYEKDDTTIKSINYFG